VFEQGGPSGKAPVVDPSSSSDEEETIPDTSCDFEFAQHFFNELNCAFLGPPGDGKIIIINDSNEEKEEALEEKSTGAEDMTASATVNPTSTISTDDTNAHAGAKNNNSDDKGPNPEVGGEDEP
jgi:hypothetical protein